MNRTASTDYFLLDSLLGPEERELRDRVRRFSQEQVLPVINGYWERAEFPFELVPKLAELQIVGGGIKGYGCPGFSHLASGLVTLELNRGDGITVLMVTHEPDMAAFARTVIHFKDGLVERVESRHRQGEAVQI